MRRKTIFLALGLTLALSATAFAGTFTPESGGSPNADDISTLYKLIGVIAIIVFVAVEGALLWAMFKFKAKKGAVAAQIHGNTRLEIGWTVGAAAILIFLVVFTFIKLPSIKNPAQTGANGLQFASSAVYASTDQPSPPDGKALKIVVDGQQYVWRFQYPGDKDVFSYEEMVVPADTTVVLAQVRVLSPEDYQQWYEDQAKRIQDAREQQSKNRKKYDSGGVAPTSNADDDQVNG